MLGRVQMKVENEEILPDKGFENCTENLEVSIFTYYKRYIRTVIERQVMLIYNGDIENSYVRNCMERKVRYSLLGCENGPVMKSILQSGQEGKILWREFSRDRDTSIHTFIKIYSDKYRTTMKTSGSVFYPLNVFIMNIRHEVNKSKIARCQSVVACLLTQCFMKENRE